MTIEIMNLRIVKPSELWDKMADGTTPVGNPFVPKGGVKEKDRNKVCDQYEEWFPKQLDGGNQRFSDYLEKLVEVYFEHDKLRLFCWCVPKRCHVETIKQHLEEFLDLDRKRRMF